MCEEAPEEIEIFRQPAGGLVLSIISSSCHPPRPLVSAAAPASLNSPRLAATSGGTNSIKTRRFAARQDRYEFTTTLRKLENNATDIDVQGGGGSGGGVKGQSRLPSIIPRGHQASNVRRLVSVPFDQKVSPPPVTH